jgi:2-enoate reductase
MAITVAHQKKNVLIIGGGLAGMEAARVSALRGHKVTLIEKNDKLGGNLIPGSVPDFKKDDRALLKWYAFQLQKLPVDIKLNYTIDKEMIEKSDADVVIFAIGSVPIELDFSSKNQIFPAIEILNDVEKAGKNIVVIGGGLIGCETALWLHEKGRNVTIVENQSEILGGGKDMCFANYDMLKDLLTFNKIEVLRSSSLKSVSDDSVMVETLNGDRSIIADTIMLAIGYHSQRELSDSMIDSRKIVYNIGDSRKVRNIMYTIWDAFFLAREL